MEAIQNNQILGEKISLQPIIQLVLHQLRYAQWLFPITLTILYLL